ncbi:MAG: SdpI family protein [Pseudonocardia sp.]
MSLGLTIAGALLAAAGVALAVVGGLAWRRRLPRNRLAGIRTAATLRDDEAFAVGNRVGAPPVLAGAAVAVLGAAVALGAPSTTAGWVLAGVSAVATVLLSGVGGVLGDRAASRVPAPAPVSCGGACAGCSLVEGCGGGPSTDRARSG